jgi:hypothetical protein
MSIITAKFVLVDQSAGALTRGGQAMDPLTLASIAGAVQRQLNVALSRHYGGTYQVRTVASVDDREQDEWPMVLYGPRNPAPPGAIAWHQVNGVGVPELFDEVGLSDTLTGPGNSCSVAISHEFLEASVDPPCNIWSDAGTLETAREVCDPVESQTYTEPMFRAVYLSNFVLPAWFIPQHPGPFDYMSTWTPNADAPRAPATRSSGTPAPTSTRSSVTRSGRASFPLGS